MSSRRKVVTVVGDGANPHREKSTVVGEWIAQSGHHLLTGGGGGVMAAVSEAFVEAVGRRGLAVGIIPGSMKSSDGRFEYRTKGSAYPNAALDIAVYTHLPGEDPEGERSRNHINVLSADLVVALPGGVGTNAEIQLAKKYRKPLLIFLNDKETILGTSAADLAAKGFVVVKSFPELVLSGNRILDPQRAARKPIRVCLGNCTFRSWQWEDAESLQRHANNRKIWRNLHDGFPSPYTFKDARRWIAHAISASPETVFAVDWDGEAVGAAGFHLKEGYSAGSAEVGYWIGEAYWGRGIATEVVRGITAFAFDEYPQLVRLYAHVFDWNVASMRVLEKAGYSREGVMRRSAAKAGQFIDMVVYSLIR